MKNQEIFTIAFLAMDGNTIVSKATRNEDNTIKLVEYNYNNTNNSLTLNENSTEKIENCGVFGRFVTIIENETETQQITENASDVFVQSIEVENAISENETEKYSKVSQNVDFVGEGYYRFVPSRNIYEKINVSKEMAETLNNDGISIKYIT